MEVGLLKGVDLARPGCLLRLLIIDNRVTNHGDGVDSLVTG